MARTLLVVAACFIIVASFGCDRLRANKANEKTAEPVPTPTPAPPASAPDNSARDRVLEKRIAFVDSLAKSKLPATATRPIVETSVTKPNLIATAEAPTVNAVLEPIDHLTNLGTNVQLSKYDEGDLHWASVYVKGRKDVDNYHLTAPAERPYFAVVRISKLVAPRIVSPNKYTPGTCQGDVLVYDFESGKQVADVPIRGTNSDQVTQHLEVVSAQKYLDDDLARGCLWSAQIHIDKAYASAK